MHIKYLSFLLSIIVLSHCQTIPQFQQVELPTVAEQRFDSCVAGDGLLAVFLYENDLFKGTADLEWLAQDNSDITIQVLSPMGQSLLNLKYLHTNHNFQRDGRLAEALPNLGVDDNQFLNIDNNFIPLKVGEINCLLKLKWPIAWLSRTTHSKRTDTELTINIQEEKRQMQLSLNKINSFDDVEGCVKIKWYVYLFFSREASVCFFSENSKQGIIKGIGNYSFKWTMVDEQ